MEASQNDVSQDKQKAMNYDYLLRLRQSHPAWRLLSADHAPLICSFLHQTFVQANIRALSQTDIVARLDDMLFHLRQSYGADTYPRAASEYLEIWAHPENAYLRKYYPAQSDEPEWDLTPATEKALSWLDSLRETRFVGTESRLLTIFNLLRELILATEPDAQARIVELEQRRAEIDAELLHLRAGNPLLPSLTPTQVRERFYQAEDTARRLLADFRQVEANFRELDRATRQKITLSDRNKAALLAEIFGEQDAISDSDQGNSFKAFWGFLMSPDRQQELQTLIARAAALPELAHLESDPLLARIKFHLLDAGEKVQRTSAQLVEQLRRFLDSQIWLENKRIGELIHAIEQQSVAFKDAPPSAGAFADFPEMRPGIELPFSRSLYTPTQEWRLLDRIADEAAPDFSTQALFDRPYVDEEKLRERIDTALAQQAQISLAELAGRFPLRQGMAELVTYLFLATRDNRAVIADEATQTLCLSADDSHNNVTLPLVIFSR